MSKALEVGKNYGGVFGLDASKGACMVYMGGDNWQLQKPGVVKDVISADTTAKALAYINQPSVSMGSVGGAYHR